jgi:predicted phage-related endonuclease
MLSERQIKKHYRYVSASNMGSVLGLNPWKSKFQYWCELAGLLFPKQPEQDEIKDRLMLDNLMEETMDRFCHHKWGWKLKKVRGKSFKRFHFLYCIPDRIRVTADRTPREAICLVEYKNIDKYQERAWVNDGVPAYYEAQVRTQSMIYELPAVLVACFGGTRIRTWEFSRDENIEKYLADEAEKFWNSLLLDEMPEPDARSTEAINRLFPTHTDLLINQEVDSPLHEQLQKISALQHEQKRLETEVENISNKIKRVIGNNEGLLFKDGLLVTWKRTKDRLSFDDEVFKKAYPDHYTNYLKTIPGYRRFNISWKGVIDT